jgi:hypothetical protein
MSRNLDGTDITYDDCIEITYRQLQAGDRIYNGLQVIEIAKVWMTGSDLASWINYQTPKMQQRNRRLAEQVRASDRVLIVRRAA